MFADYWWKQVLAVTMAHACALDFGYLQIRRWATMRVVWAVDQIQTVTPVLPLELQVCANRNRPLRVGF